MFNTYSLEAETYENFSPSHLTFPEIEKFAQDISKQYNFNYREKSIDQFVIELGGKIEFLDGSHLEDFDGGILIVHNINDFTIYLSPVTSPLRDKFTMAHELGHYFLHSGNPYGSLLIAARRTKGSLVEFQANRFAAALLMPKSDFREIARRTNNDKMILSGRFNVSIAAVEARLKSLGLE